jgi:hypothetical protein
MRSGAPRRPAAALRRPRIGREVGRAVEHGPDDLGPDVAVGIRRPPGWGPGRGDDRPTVDGPGEDVEPVLTRPPTDEAATERAARESSVPGGRGACLLEGHGIGNVDLEPRHRACLGDQDLAVEGTQRAVLVADQGQRGVEPNSAAQADLDRPIELGGEHAGAVAAVAAVPRSVEAPAYLDRRVDGTI